MCVFEKHKLSETHTHTTFVTEWASKLSVNTDTAVRSEKAQTSSLTRPQQSIYRHNQLHTSVISGFKTNTNTFNHIIV